jgi:hypothetical protein
MFIAAVVFSTQVADSNTVKQKDKQSLVTPNNNTDKSKNTRSITVGNSKSNWSKIKDMFM